MHVNHPLMVGIVAVAVITADVPLPLLPHTVVDCMVLANGNFNYVLSWKMFSSRKN